ncbi:MAG: SPFH domain-containing protein [Phycisphaeraceae bacterium]|nr:SPFH domain-containing protein [Phycisphaerae bacterium]MBX3392241.1 SPFH domain-containing protein [Phycisphaeraceae bacterium]
MSIWKAIRGELIDIIEWLDSTRDTLVWRYPRHDNEIKNGARLVVRESQAAVFVNEGQVADVFEFPGTFTLTTQNLPLLSKLKGWKYGFESPFKAEVYFVNTRRFTDLKWGTKNPVMLRDADFGPVRLRAFGTYVLRVAKPVDLIRSSVGTDARFTTDEITDQLRNLIVSRFADTLGEGKIPALDLAANYDSLAAAMLAKLGPEFEQYGIEVPSLLIENISLPPEVEQMLDKRTSMGVLGDMNRFTQFQAANALGDAAKNPGGAAGAGVGVGAGIAMGQAMAGAMAGAANPPPASGPAAPPPMPVYHLAVGGQQVGPLDMAGLQARVRSGELTQATLVWTPGMAQWTAAGTVPGLAALFGTGSAPPPLPNG